MSLIGSFEGAWKIATSLKDYGKSVLPALGRIIDVYVHMKLSFY